MWVCNYNSYFQCLPACWHLRDTSHIVMVLSFPWALSIAIFITVCILTDDFGHAINQQLLQHPYPPHSQEFHFPEARYVLCAKSITKWFDILEICSWLWNRAFMILIRHHQKMDVTNEIWRHSIFTGAWIWLNWTVKWDSKFVASSGYM